MVEGRRAKVVFYRRREVSLELHPKPANNRIFTFLFTLLNDSLNMQLIYADSHFFSSMCSTWNCHLNMFAFFKPASCMRLHCRSCITPYRNGWNCTEKPLPNRHIHTLCYKEWGVNMKIDQTEGSRPTSYKKGSAKQTHTVT